MDKAKSERLANLFIDVFVAIESMPDPTLSAAEAMAMGARYMASFMAERLFFESVLTKEHGARIMEGLGLDATDVLGCVQTGKKGWPDRR